MNSHWTALNTTEFSYQLWSCPIFLLKPKRADWLMCFRLLRWIFMSLFWLDCRNLMGSYEFVLWWCGSCTCFGHSSHFVAKIHSPLCNNSNSLCPHVLTLRVYMYTIMTIELHRHDSEFPELKVSSQWRSFLVVCESPLSNDHYNTFKHKE